MTLEEEKKERKGMLAIHTNIEEMITAKAEAMPSDFNKTRFIQNVMVVLQDVKDIESMDGRSVARTILKGAFLGLDFFQKECYAIPYAGSLNFQTDYRGEIKVVKKYAIREIKDLYAKIVRNGDDYAMEERDGEQTMTFKPLPFNDGEIKGAFAIVMYTDGGIQIEEMSKKDIDAVKVHYSKQATGKAWTNSPGEMYKKTVLRRLCKHINTDFSVDQARAFEDGGAFEFKNKKKEQVVATSSLDDVSESNKEDVIEAEFEDKDVPPDVSESNKETA